jgi:hypothetical protein
MESPFIFHHQGMMLVTISNGSAIRIFDYLKVLLFYYEIMDGIEMANEFVFWEIRRFLWDTLPFMLADCQLLVWNMSLLLFLIIPHVNASSLWMPIKWIKNALPLTFNIAYHCQYSISLQINDFWSVLFYENIYVQSHTTTNKNLPCISKNVYVKLH